MARPRRTREREAGAAVVTALLIVTLATTVVAGLYVRENVTVRSVENRLALSQTRWIERAALDWAKVILRADARSGTVDHLGEPWAVPVAETRLDETVTAGARISDSSRSATLAGQIVDAQSRLNVVSLVQAGKPVEAQVEAFRKLLGLVGLSESLVDPVLMRVQRSQPGLVDGKPVPAVDLPLLRLSDLLAIPGFDAGAIEKLAPFAIVLPNPTLVNVNTAPAEVIAALVEGLDLAGARRFVAKRERTYFRSLTEASALLEGQPALPPTAMAVASGYFIVRGVVRFDRVEATTETLLARNTDRVEIIWQQRY